MQYEAVLLELMSRIKVLEADVANLKQSVQALENGQRGEPEQASRTKLTESMMEVCYDYGKKAFQTPGANMGEYATAAAAQVHMNRSSAFMYIYAVKCMLEGNGFKRALSAASIRYYFDAIYRDFGRAGLARALRATRKYVEYCHGLGHTVNSVARLCDQFENRVR